MVTWTGMFPVICHIGGHSLISWTVLALVGAWFAYFTLKRDFVRSGIPAWQVDAFFAGAALIWFLGAHAGQTLTVPTLKPMVSFGTRDIFSGLVLYGGVLLTFAYAIAVWAAVFRKKMLIHELLDSGTLALAWAMFFGRLGCTLYGCCYGSPSGHWPGYMLNKERWDYEHRVFPSSVDGLRLHPATLYEALGWLLIIVMMYWMRRKEALKPGSFPPAVAGGFAWLAYAAMRFSLEFIRMDPRGSGPWGLTPSQWIALAFVPFCLVLIPTDWKAKRVPIRLRNPQPRDPN